MPAFVPSAENTEVMTSILDAQKVKIISQVPSFIQDLKAQISYQGLWENDRKNKNINYCSEFNMLPLLKERVFVLLSHSVAKPRMAK